MMTDEELEEAMEVANRLKMNRPSENDCLFASEIIENLILEIGNSRGEFNHLAEYSEGGFC